MINYIKRKDLDLKKYNNCVENAIQTRIYALSWYLDIVAENWGVLVWNDYEAVMPIPWKRKYFIKYVAQPVFCQQLGVFSKIIFSKELQKEITAHIPSFFLSVRLNLNAHNFSTSTSIPMKNYVLNLNEEYLTLFKSFSKGRKHAVKVGEKNELAIKNISVLELIKIKKKFYKHIDFSEKTIVELTNAVLNNNKGFVLGVFKGEILLGGGLFLEFNHRVTYLFSSFNKEGRKLQAASFLISSVIKKYNNSNYVLDFEGGNLPNIASFFKSFSAKNEHFHLFKHHSLLKFVPKFKQHETN